MNKHEDIIRRIQEKLSTLSKSERKVAEAILALSEKQFEEQFQQSGGQPVTRTASSGTTDDR